MLEIEKLRLRLKNMDKNSKEYRMTVSEAKKLSEEFFELESVIKTLSSKPPEQSVVVEQARDFRIIDGGSF